MLHSKFGKDIPVEIETDVNSCALLEYTILSKEYFLIKFNFENRISSSVAYITVGTGIGIGIVVNKDVVHGLVHPEGGHMRVTKRQEDKDFKGVCPFHGDCLEGLCTNNSIAARKQVTIEDLPKIPDSDPIWDLIAYYLAQAIVNLTLVISPEKVIIGGGVMNRAILLGMIHKQFIPILNKYVQHPMLETPEKYIIAPKYHPDNGLMAGILLGMPKIQ